jgi:hypothetical protein
MREAAPMGSISVACYKPKPGKEEVLLELVRKHLPPLRAEGLVTDRPSIVMRAADGTLIEIFEWVSQEAIAGAHSNPVVLDLWKRFEEASTYEVPANLPEFQQMFAHFEPLSFEMNSVTDHL